MWWESNSSKLYYGRHPTQCIFLWALRWLISVLHPTNSYSRLTHKESNQVGSIKVKYLLAVFTLWFSGPLSQFLFVCLILFLFCSHLQPCLGFTSDYDHRLLLVNSEDHMRHWGVTTCNSNVLPTVLLFRSGFRKKTGFFYISHFFLPDTKLNIWIQII